MLKRGINERNIHSTLVAVELAKHVLARLVNIQYWYTGKRNLMVTSGLLTGLLDF
jgi:hypothetical protein